MRFDPGVCRSCGAAIFWVRTVNGRAMPIDQEPSARGNLQLAEYANGDAMVVALRKGETATEPLFVSHFATCEFASQHRR